MTEQERQVLIRRAFLRRAAFLGGAEVLPALSVDNPRLAEQKVPPDVLHFRRGDQRRCGRCALFTGGEHARADGVCQLVAGLISPLGICDAWSLACAAT